MARISFRLPDIGEGIAEAEVVAWHVRVGDTVAEEAPLADLMTDKATVEMVAPVAGRVVALNGAVGDQVAIGSVLAVFETAGEGMGPEPDPAPAPEQPPRHPSEPVVPSDVEGPGEPTPGAPASLGATAGDGDRAAKPLASPAVRQRAKELGVDLAEIRVGEGERIRHRDLDAYLAYAGGRAARAHEPDEVEEVRVTGLRRRIAENMAEAKRRIPHFAYVEEVDVTALEALRAAMNDGRRQRPRLTPLPFLIRAIVRAVAEHPMVNARYDDEAGVVRRHRAVHLGLATQTGAGLTVPVLRDAGARDVWALAAEIVRLAEAARSGRATRAELSGSTITLTSLGALGGIASTPVINRPEVAIVGVNRIVERPAVVDGRIEVRKLMNLSSSFDHRVVDGMDAARFVQAVRGGLETPALLFVE